MDYDEALRWWFARVDYERRAPQPGDLKLDRMRELLRRLGDPHAQFKSVHVAGSKGKGSTCAMLESVLRHAGYRTGLFTSPHLTDVRERIQVNNDPITPAELVAAADAVRPAVEALEAEGQWPTFFEVATALGFLHFAWRQVESAVVEVGLGGQFDSTNVLIPLVSVITSISLDHTAILGETVEKIAFEKAGIIKPGVPVVSGVTEPGPRQVIERVAAEHGAPLVQLRVDFSYVRKSFRSVTVATAGRQMELPAVLLGDHQAANSAVAVAAIDQLIARATPVSDTAIVEGFRAVRWPARFEWINTRPQAILDCAHNVASAEALVNTIREMSLPRPRALIFAASNDKDVAGMFRVLAPEFAKVYLTRSESPRAMQPEELALALPAGTASAYFGRPIDAWEAARAETPADGLIVIAGSVFLAGELRPRLLADRL